MVVNRTLIPRTMPHHPEFEEDPRVNPGIPTEYEIKHQSAVIAGICFLLVVLIVLIGILSGGVRTP